MEAMEAMEDMETMEADEASAEAQLLFVRLENISFIGPFIGVRRGIWTATDGISMHIWLSLTYFFTWRNWFQSLWTKAGMSSRVSGKKYSLEFLWHTGDVSNTALLHLFQPGRLWRVELQRVLSLEGVDAGSSSARREATHQALRQALRHVQNLQTETPPYRTPYKTFGHPWHLLHCKSGQNTLKICKDTKVLVLCEYTWLKTERLV